MTTVLPNMGLTLPTRGAPGAGAWGDTEDANLALTDSHDHTSGHGSLIPTAGLNINADLSFSSLYAPVALNRITFSSIAALSSNNKSLFVNLADNELYWRSNAGANVKLTAGSALNVSAFTGGIGGDYTAVAASEQYDDANKRYTFKQGGGTTWARLQSGPLRLLELGTSETVFVEQAAPSALAASYTVTWPLALPAAKTIMQIDNSGVMTNALAAPASKSFITMDNSGTLATTATSEQFSHNAGLILLGGAATKANGSLSGPSATRVVLGTETIIQVCPIVAAIGTLTAWSVSLNKSSASGTITAKLAEGSSSTAGTGSATQLGSTQSNNANNPGAISLGQTGQSIAMTAGREYWIEVAGGGVSGDIIVGYSVTVSVSPP